MWKRKESKRMEGRQKFMQKISEHFFLSVRAHTPAHHLRDTNYYSFNVKHSHGKIGLPRKVPAQQKRRPSVEENLRPSVRSLLPDHCEEQPRIRPSIFTGVSSSSPPPNTPPPVRRCLGKVPLDISFLSLFFPSDFDALCSLDP